MIMNSMYEKFYELTYEIKIVWQSCGVDFQYVHKAHETKMTWVVEIAINLIPFFSGSVCCISNKSLNRRKGFRKRRNKGQKGW